MLPEEIKIFVEIISKLPSIGPRQATRLAFRLISGYRDKLDSITNAFEGLKNVRLCEKCFFIHTNAENFCNICLDKSRTQDVFMIIEKETELMSIEQTGKYKGRYLIIGELTRSGVLESWQRARLNVLKKIIKEESPNQKTKEIILALNPTTYGDLNASLVEKDLKDFAIKISRIGRGIPTGGEIEFADSETLTHSILRRE